MTQETFDGMCKTVIDKCGLDGAVPWVLMASLLYYQADISILSDTFFDRLCKDMDVHWSELQHPHKDLIGRPALKSGTCFHLALENYPRSVRGAALSLITGRGFGLTNAIRDKIYDADFEPPLYCWDTYTYGPKGQTWREYRETLIPIDLEPEPAPTIRVRHRTQPVEAEEPTQPTIRVRQRPQPTGATA
jgi:hypothetical protein